MIVRTCPLLPALLLLACRANPALDPADAGAPARPADQPTDKTAEKTAEKLGVLAPVDGTELSIWPETHAGGWLVLEVLPQGTPVKEGDVIARLDARAIDEELQRGELELQTSRLNHQGLQERNQLETQAAQSALARARAALERARRSLESWKRDELAFDQRQEDLSRRWQEANVEDQTDELDQLEKMYAGDELVDATEDIVLKRSRRGLAITQSQNELSRDRARHRRELELALQTEQREDDFRSQQEALARLELQQAIEARGRADGALRSGAALAEQTEKLARLGRDRAFFELRAPCAGLLLHGAARDYRPGKTPARHERGSQLTARTELFVVAPAEPLGVTFDVTDAERARFASGTNLAVHALAGGATTSARARLADYPRTLSTSEATLEGSATLAAPLAGTHYGERVRLQLAVDAPERP